MQQKGSTSSEKPLLDKNDKLASGNASHSKYTISLTRKLCIGQGWIFFIEQWSQNKSLSWKVGLYLFDCTVHSAIIFGWSSISEIIKENGFFLESNLIGDRRNTSSEEIIDVKTENKSCFVMNEEQGGQSKEQGSTDTKISNHD